MVLHIPQEQGLCCKMSSPGQWWIPKVSSPPPHGSGLQHSLCLTPHIIHPTSDLRQQKVSNLLPSTLPFLPFSLSSLFLPWDSVEQDQTRFVHPQWLLIQSWHHFVKMISVSLGELASPFIG